jgi:hypothetical protein
MDNSLSLTDDERSFLRHWSYESSCPFWGPASIWCKNHRISSAYGPYPLAELYWAQEIEAGREGWIFERPSIPFRVPWKGSEEFWLRSNAALAQIPRLQGDSWAAMMVFSWDVKGTLTPDPIRRRAGRPRTSAHGSRGLPLDGLPHPLRGTIRPQVRLPRVGLGPQVDIDVVDRTEETQRSLLM